MMRPLLLAAVAAIAFAGQADAHAALERALPPVGSQVATPPAQLVLNFTEGVEPRFCTVELRDPQGAPVAIGAPKTDPGNNRRLIVSLPTLGKGRYTVIWHATSVDTHKTEGSYQFTVAP